MYYLILKI